LRNDPNEWREELPDNCPPPEAFDPNSRKFYRLVKNLPPTDRDFYSTRQESPERKIGSECIARSVSILSTKEGCLKRKSLPLLRNKIPAEITLPSGSGLVMQTLQDKFHYSWWVKRGFDPIPHCQRVEVGS